MSVSILNAIFEAMSEAFQRNEEVKFPFGSRHSGKISAPRVYRMWLAKTFSYG
jgi:hypothetical protein